MMSISLRVDPSTTLSPPKWGIAHLSHISCKVKEKAFAIQYLKIMIYSHPQFKKVIHRRHLSPPGDQNLLSTSAGHNRNRCRY